MGEQLGAARAVILWEGTGGWRSLGPASPRDDLLVDLVDVADGPLDSVETSELGAVGRRLAAAGLDRLSLLPLDPGGAVVVFEEPRLPIAELGSRRDWLLELLDALDRLGHLEAFRSWVGDLTAVAASSAATREGLGRLVDAFGAAAVAMARPSRRGVVVTSCGRGADQHGFAEDVHFDLDWPAVLDDPSGQLRPQLERVAPGSGDSPALALVGRAEPVDTVVVIVGAADLEPDADVVAALLGQVQQSSGRLQRSGDRARVEERTRLATVLHEELSQRLASLSVRIDILSNRSRASAVVDDLLELRTEVVEAVESLRSALYELAPPEPTWVELADGLRRFVEDHGGQRGLTVDYAVRGEPRPVDPEQVSLVFAAVQEALTNVAKHAGTDEAAVELAFEEEVVTVTVTDEGCGMREDASEQAGWGHQGLGVLRTRARLAGASLQITGTEGEGTTMALMVPTAPEGGVEE